MPTPVIKIDQAGLPAGTAGRARSDGLDTGALVTLESTGPGGTHTFRLLWVPSGDTTAVGSLAVTGNPRIWTFSPTAGVYGSWLIELEVDGQRSRRVFGVRTPNLALLIPAFNEDADDDANLFLNGAAQVEASDNNEPYYRNPAIDYAGWWASLEDAFLSLDTVGGGGGGATTVTPIRVFGDSPLSPVINDTVRFDPTGGAMVANLPTAVGQSGEILEFKRTTTNTNNLTLTPFGGQTIDGAASLVLGGPGSAYEVTRLRSDGANWMVVS